MSHMVPPNHTFTYFFHIKLHVRIYASYLRIATNTTRSEEWGFCLGILLLEALVLCSIWLGVGLGCGCKNIDMTWDKTYLLIRLRLNSLRVLQLFEFVSPTCFVDFFVKL